MEKTFQKATKPWSLPIFQWLWGRVGWQPEGGHWVGQLFEKFPQYTHLLLQPLEDRVQVLTMDS